MLRRDHLLNKRRAKAIVKDLYGGGATLSGLVKLKGGKSNAAYRLDIAGKNSGSVLVRSAHIKKKCLLNHEKKMMAAEESTLRFLKEAGIPVPEFYKYCPLGTVIDREYAVYEYIASDYPADRSKVDYAGIDTLVSKMHALSYQDFGFLGGQRFGSWYEFIKSFSNELLNLAEKYSFFKEKRYVKELREEIATAADIFNEINEARFVHNDIGCKNFLFRYDGERYKAFCVIDIEHSLTGDVDFEYSRAQLTDRFCYDNVMLAGRENMTSARAARLRIYALLNDLISMHIMRVKYFIPGYFKELRKRFIVRFNEKNTYMW